MTRTAVPEGRPFAQCADSREVVQVLLADGDVLKSSESPCRAVIHSFHADRSPPISSHRDRRDLPGARCRGTTLAGRAEIAPPRSSDHGERSVGLRGQRGGSGASAGVARCDRGLVRRSVSARLPRRSSGRVARMIVLDASVMIAVLDSADPHFRRAKEFLASSLAERLMAHRLTLAEIARRGRSRGPRAGGVRGVGRARESRRSISWMTTANWRRRAARSATSECTSSTDALHLARRAEPVTRARRPRIRARAAGDRRLRGRRLLSRLGARHPRWRTSPAFLRWRALNASLETVVGTKGGRAGDHVDFRAPDRRRGGTAGRELRPRACQLHEYTATGTAVSHRIDRVRSAL